MGANYPADRYVVRTAGMTFHGCTKVLLLQYYLYGVVPRYQ